MKPRVRIKFCGGCNPDYDRIALVEDLKARLAGMVVWVSAEDDPFDMVLAVHGCQTACMDLTAFGGYHIHHIHFVEDLDPLVEEMRSKG